jgi:hypothetical protein
VHLASLGYRLQPEFSSRSRSRCSEGGFGLWLGDEGIVVVKRAHNPLYSNKEFLGVITNWRRCRGEEIEAQLPWETTRSSFDDRQSLDIIWL